MSYKEWYMYIYKKNEGKKGRGKEEEHVKFVQNQMLTNLHIKDFKLLSDKLAAFSGFNFHLFCFCWPFLGLFPFGRFLFSRNLKRGREEEKIQKDKKQLVQAFPFNFSSSVTLFYHPSTPPHSQLFFNSCLVATLPSWHQFSLWRKSESKSPLPFCVLPPLTGMDMGVPHWEKQFGTVHENKKGGVTKISTITSCVVSAKLYNLSGPQFPTMEWWSLLHNTVGKIT